MSTPYNIDNEGIGAGDLLTMSVDTTEDREITQEFIDSNLTACVVSGNNEVGLGASGDKLFGKVISVSAEYAAGTTVPACCTVQARGVARFNYVATAPVLNGMVEVDGAGAVKKSTATDTVPAGGQLTRGQVIAIDTDNETVDVWLG